MLGLASFRKHLKFKKKMLLKMRIYGNSICSEISRFAQINILKQRKLKMLIENQLEIL